LLSFFYIWEREFAELQALARRFKLRAVMNIDKLKFDGLSFTELSGNGLDTTVRKVLSSRSRIIYSSTAIG
jgi:hypothetical protein